MAGKQTELKDKGNEFFKAQKFAQAVEWYTKAIDVAPQAEETGAIYSNRAASYVSLKKFDEAIRDADACIQLRPDWVKGYFRKAVAYDQMGNIDQAEVWYTKALSKEPENADISKKLQAMREAIQSRNKAASPGKCTTAKDAKAIGNSFFKASNYETAMGYYTRAIELSEGKQDPERHIYFNNRATCHAQTHNYKQTIIDCGDALDCESIDPPGRVKALLRRALAYEGLEKWQKALDDYQEVGRIAPGTLQATQGAQRCGRMLR
eukprot:TRINITY_DN15727_c0_g1_i1.p1 TRINITY_DN15727_c0_g1~~TRINITY_DN15727_c0_g1_i1.p1  ORF type:complete len:295 (+),score=115.96 TRINITY_DN15727_c0_g1_i1:94-885(+)